MQCNTHLTKSIWPFYLLSVFRITQEKLKVVQKKKKERKTVNWLNMTDFPTKSTLKLQNLQMKYFFVTLVEKYTKIILCLHN